MVITFLYVFFCWGGGAVQKKSLGWLKLGALGFSSFELEQYTVIRFAHDLGLQKGTLVRVQWLDLRKVLASTKRYWLAYMTEI